MNETTDPRRFGDYTPCETDQRDQGIRHRFRFPNGHGASVIQGPYTYGGEAGLWEAGVIVLKDDGSYHLTDVIGWQTDEQIELLLRQIEALAPATSESPA